MPTETHKEEVADVHVQMWKHYDNLRLQKQGIFLTANTILAVVAGLSASKLPQISLALPAIGIFVGIAWFLLLTRNAAYIAYHRSRVGEDWTPVTWAPKSSLSDRALPVAFSAFWVALLVQGLCGSA